MPARRQRPAGQLRHLPVRPDLDQLRHQAKDLLRAIRAGDIDAFAEAREFHPRRPAPPDTKLANAQLALARSYGAPSWPRLVQSCELIDAICEDDRSRVRALVTAHPNLLHEDARIVRSNWGQPLARRETPHSRAVRRAWLRVSGYCDDGAASRRTDLLERRIAHDPSVLERPFSYEEIYPPELGCQRQSRAYDESFARTPIADNALLHVCVEFDELDIARWLLERGMSANGRAVVDSNGFGGHTPLFSTVVCYANFWRNFTDGWPGTRKLAVGDFALEHGADPKARASFHLMHYESALGFGT